MATGYTILDLEQAKIWEELLTSLPKHQQDVYYSPALYRLHENKGDGKALCFVFKDNEGLALYPFLLNRINDLGYDLNGDYYDVQGVYGYNGVVANCKADEFLRDMNDAWLEWASLNRIVAEFLRYNPVLKNENLCNWAKPVSVLENVLLPLRDYQRIWDIDFSKKVRTDLRKAAQYGLDFQMFSGHDVTQDHLKAVMDLYISTMNRRDADEFYYFTKNYFHDLVKSLPDNVLVSFAMYKGIAITTDLMLHNGKNCYGFLSGSLPEYNYLKANRFLRSEEIKYLIDRGFEFYSMGGGLADGDSIFTYKKAFSTKTKSLFHIGKRIHDQEIYDCIVTQWGQRVGNSAAEYSNLVLKYRFGFVR